MLNGFGVEKKRRRDGCDSSSHSFIGCTAGVNASFWVEKESTEAIDFIPLSSSSSSCEGCCDESDNEDLSFNVCGIFSREFSSKLLIFRRRLEKRVTQGESNLQKALSIAVEYRLVKGCHIAIIFRII